MASRLTKACTAPESVKPKIRGHSVSQNMKKPSRKLLPMASSQPTSARSTAPVISPAPGSQMSTDRDSRTDQACDCGRRLAELVCRLVTAALDGLGHAVPHVGLEQLQGDRLEGPRGSRDLLED